MPSGIGGVTDWAGDAPTNGISPGVVLDQEWATAQIAAGIEAVIEERYG